jgi:hypothetical protein
VRDEAHVGLVDAHAEGDGGHHHEAVLAQEAVLVGAARVGLQARRGRAAPAMPSALQPLRGLLDLAPARAVDDACVAGVLVAQEAQQLRSGSSFSTMV